MSATACRTEQAALSIGSATRMLLARAIVSSAVQMKAESLISSARVDRYQPMIAFVHHFPYRAARVGVTAPATPRQNIDGRRAT
jgi:hypothetical protein